ncbi:MAG: DUF521 domain-containing protein [Gammaproteobacteria bacterium]|nr:DUF521 domain-containing protein [Gammaproteobacteria bacterium]
MAETRIAGRSLVEGRGEGRLLLAHTGLSFWGGVDPRNGDIIDHHHPLYGQNLAGRVLAIPGGRGSCSGSGVLLELILNGHAPAALVFSSVEEILTLGVLVADEMFQCSLPVLRIEEDDFARLRGDSFACVNNTALTLFEQPPDDHEQVVSSDSLNSKEAVESIDLEEIDRELLNGKHGKAAQTAMQIVLRMAVLQGAKKLLPVSRAHIDGCIYTGPASLRFARRLADWGARVSVPTTLNAISVDKRHWREQGVDPAFGDPASRLADAYLDMGAQLSFTCAPYLLDSAPVLGEQIGWAESNAVIYANSVIGARTQKYPDYLDICIALTGRAPATGSHQEQGRIASLVIEMPALTEPDDSFWPLAGYHLGLLAGPEIPLIYGLEKTSPSLDDLKAFSAAFATTSSSPMFHIAGVTPESGKESNKTINHRKKVSLPDLLQSWRALNTAEDSRVDMVSLGNPHFSQTECARLAELCAGRTKHAEVDVVVTLGRAVYEQAANEGSIKALENFGVRFITDTCWCMLQEPVIQPAVRTLMTNSGKYAHYAPGLVGRRVHFGSLADCVDAACCARRTDRPPAWLTATGH